MDTLIKEGFADWLIQLESEKETLEKAIKDAENSYDLLRAKFYVAEEAMNNFSHKRKSDFLERYVKPIENELDSMESHLEKMKAENRQKISELSVLIASLKNRIR